MHNLTVKSCTVPRLLAPRLKIFDFVGYRTPDRLGQRQMCYHLSQRGGLTLGVLQGLYEKYLHHCRNMTMVSSRAASFVDINKDC